MTVECDATIIYKILNIVYSINYSYNNSTVTSSPCLVGCALSHLEVLKYSGIFILNTEYQILFWNN